MQAKQYLYGLIGYPIGHSQSPRLFHQYAPLRMYADYQLFPLSNLKELPKLIEQYQPLGLNITSPYKEKILHQFKSLTMSPEVLYLEACNTLVLNYKNNKLSHVSAHNTDVFGFRESIKPLLTTSPKLPIIILGSGGAARAVALAMKELGYTPDLITYVSRTPQKTLLKFNQFDSQCTHQVISYNELNEQLYTPAILINASPMGMGENSAPNIDYSKLSPQHICYDLIYSQTKTPFLQQAHLYGAKCKNGEEMLRLQAERAWAIWLDNFPSLP